MCVFELIQEGESDCWNVIDVQELELLVTLKDWLETELGDFLTLGDLKVL